MIRRIPFTLVLVALVLAAWAGCNQVGPGKGSAERELVIVAGQSNAVGFDAFATELPPDPVDEAVMFWWRVGDPPPDEHDGSSGRAWTHLQPQPKGTPKVTVTAEERAKSPRQYGNFKQPAGGFGPEMGFAREWRARDARPLAIIKVAFSGTDAARDWNPDLTGEGGACYRALREEATAAIAAARVRGVTLRLRALVWVQGESDANRNDAPAYAANLERMLARLRADLEAPAMVALLGVNTRFGNGRNAFMPEIMAQQRALAARDPRCRYVDTAGAETLAPSHTHFTTQGTLEIGRRFAAAWRDHEQGKP